MATKFVDIHMHTYHSDGQFSPAEVVQAAAKRGLEAIAITDHDNTRGAREALPLAAAAGIELVTGIEMTTHWPEASLPPEDQNVDLLGYLVDLDDPWLLTFAEDLLADVHARIEDCCAALTRDGCPLAMTEVFAENPRYGGALQAIQAILRKGLAASWPEAFQRFDAAWSKARPPARTIQEAIAVLHRAGGLAVLAHPTMVRPGGETLSAGWLGRLVEAGLDGVEVYHYRLNEAARAHFLGLARGFGLAVTGGSDFHGWGKGLSQMDGRAVPVELLEELRRRKDLAPAKTMEDLERRKQPAPAKTLEDVERRKDAA
jgi:predicted metal-dependent phosphoesterase TrpH